MSDQESEPVVEVESGSSQMQALLQRLSHQLHSLQEDVGGLHDRMDGIEAKHSLQLLQVTEPHGSRSPSSTSNARRPSLIPHGGDAEEVLPSDAAEPSTEARRAFLARATKPMNVILQGQSNFAAWSFSLKTALLIVNLGDFVLKQAMEPPWLAQHPEIKKAAYILVVSSLSPSQSALIQNQAPNPRAVYRHLFQAIMGGSSSTRDQRASQLRSIRLHNVGLFAQYAEEIVTRSQELLLLGDASFTDEEQKRLLLAGMVDAAGSSGFAILTTMIYTLRVESFAETARQVGEALKRNPDNFKLARSGRAAFVVERAFSAQSSSRGRGRGRGHGRGRGRDRADTGRGAGRAKKTSAKPCFQFRDTGQCDRTNCRYSHEPAAEAEKTNVATVVEQEFAFLTDAPGKIAGDTWIFDSGASTHISNDERDFASRHRTGKRIRGAFGNSYNASFSGKAILSLAHGAKTRTVSLNGTLCAKEMEAKLLSVPALDKKELSTVFNDGRVAVFRKDGVLVMTGTLFNKQYRLDPSVDESVKAKIMNLFQ